MKMANVNPLNAKYCVDFTLAKTPPHLITTNLAKMDPLKLKFSTYKPLKWQQVSIKCLIFR